MMTIKELYTKLIELGINKDSFYIQGIYGSTNDDDKYALIIRKEVNALVYEVYYKEKGEKNLSKKFSNEDQACQYMYKRLKDHKEIEDTYFKHK